METAHDNSHKPHLEEIVRRVIRESRLYSNFSFLVPEQQEQVTQAMMQIVQILSEINKNLSDDQLAQAAGDALFSVLAMKSTSKIPGIDEN